MNLTCSFVHLSIEDSRGGSFGKKVIAFVKNWNDYYWLILTFYGLNVKIFL